MATLENPRRRADVGSIETLAGASDSGRTPPETTGEHEPVIASIVHVFTQVRAALERVSDEQYRQGGPVGLGGTLGGHVRHSLDHLCSLLDCRGTGRLDYDDRRRGTDIETSRRTATAAIGRALDELGRAATIPGDEAIVLRVMVAGDGSAIETATTTSREYAFILSHTVHHAAMIKAILAHHSVAVPDDFGVAPSTLNAIRTGQVGAPSPDDGTACAR